MSAAGLKQTNDMARRLSDSSRCPNDGCGKPRIVLNGRALIGGRGVEPERVSAATHCACPPSKDWPNGGPAWQPEYGDAPTRPGQVEHASTTAAPALEVAKKVRPEPPKCATCRGRATTIVECSTHTTDTTGAVVPFAGDPRYGTPQWYQCDDDARRLINLLEAAGARIFTYALVMRGAE